MNSHGLGGHPGSQTFYETHRVSHREAQVTHDRGTLWLLPRAGLYRGSLGGSLCGSPPINQ